VNSPDILDSSSNIEVIRPAISSGTPFYITDTRGTTGIIDTSGTIDVFHPVPSGVVDIPDASDIRD